MALKASFVAQLRVGVGEIFIRGKLANTIKVYKRLSMFAASIHCQIKICSCKCMSSFIIDIKHISRFFIAELFVLCTSPLGDIVSSNNYQQNNAF